MSCILTMTSLAVIAGLSLTQISAAAISEILSGKKQKDYAEGFETVFNDASLLYNSLIAFDCHVEVISENEYLVETENGKLRYYRDNPNQPFSIYFDQIDNPDGLLRNINEFEENYGRNVQDYTYNHIKNNLADNMRIYDEQIVDDELVLTVSID